MNIRHTLTTLFITLLAAGAAGAGGSGGSIYSRFGVGDLRFTSSSQLFSMGGTAAAVSSASAINDVNPGAWTGIDKVRFSVSARYEGFSTDDGTSSVYLAGIHFNGLSLAIPVSTGNGIVFGAGVTPYSRVNYRAATTETQAGLNYTVKYQGDGGISRAFAGLSANLMADLHAGAAFNYYFGTGRYALEQGFTGSPLSGADLTKYESFKGVGSTLGVVYDGAGGFFNLGEAEVLSVGVSLSTTSYPRINTEKVYHYGAAVSTATPDTVAAGERKFRLPYSLTGGVSYRNDRLQIAADVRYQGWEGTVIEEIPYAVLRDSYRFSVGAEITPGRNPGDIFSRNTTYRFGLYHDAGYLRINGETVAESGITAGLSFTILNETRLSLSGGFAMRGTTDNGLQSDRIFRFSASLDVTELWFQRPVEE